VYGADGVNFLTTMLQLARTRDSVRVVSDQRGTPTLDADLARALLEIATQLMPGGIGSQGGIYHVAGRGETTWLGFSEAMFSGRKRRGHRVPAIVPIAMADWPGPARRPRDSRLDCSKVERTFGIALPDWRESLERVLDAVAEGEMANRPA